MARTTEQTVSRAGAEAGAQTGLAARRAALFVVEQALARRGGLETALAGPEVTALDPRERAFARALAMVVLRRKGTLDRMLSERVERAPPELVRALLRLGAAQVLHLDVPAHAAVATTLDLAGADRATRPFKGLINAVLRGLAREGAPQTPPEVLAPDWLQARWRAAYGEADASATCALIAEEPATDITPRDPAEAPAIAEALEGEVLPGGQVRTRRKGDLAGWPGYAEGRWWVQDASAAIPARLLAVKPGETALDLCAAPGGKALQLAAAGAQVTALDRSPARLERLKDNFARMGLAAEAIAASAETWDDPRQFDAVLLDAPCTATGTFRRHPDVLWAARPSDIASLAAVQARLLNVAAERVKPGGRLIYCVCSLEPEEGEAQIDAFAAAHPEFRLDPPAPGEGGAPPASLTAAGTLRILPHQQAGGTDGFFIARLVRLPGEETKVKSSP